MDHRKLARLLVLVSVLWIVSNVVLVVQPQTASSVIAALAPTAMPQSMLRSPSTLSHVYLPFVACAGCPPPAPAMTTSRYIVTTSLSQMDTAGCNQGLAGESGQVILDFGYPFQDSYTGYYGTKLLRYPDYPFVDSLSEEHLAVDFMLGWARCAPSNTTLEVALGLNNSSKYWQFTADHAQDWASMTSDLASIVSGDSRLVGRVSVAGAMDIEFDWNGPTITRQWVDAFDPGWLVPFYNFGSCDSCPWFQYPAWQPLNGWSNEDIYYVSSRQSNNGTTNLPFPEIYKTNTENADQWYRVSLYGVNKPSNPLYFRGTLTQYYACQDNNNWNDCLAAGTYNTAAQGWTQLWQALNVNPQTALGAPIVSSDIRWSITNVR